MVTYLVSNHIGIRKVTIGTQLLLHAHEERQVEIKTLVATAIEGAHSSLTLTASSACHATIKNHVGVTILAQALLLENLRPDVLGTTQDLF